MMYSKIITNINTWYHYVKATGNIKSRSDFSISTYENMTKIQDKVVQ